MVQLTVPQKAWLDEEAKRVGISVSELIRRIIDVYRERKSS